MEVRSREFLQRAGEAISDQEHARSREALGRHMPELRTRAVADFGSGLFAELKESVRKTREHTLNHLGHYLETFTRNARENGNSVHFARDPGELNDLVVDICARHEARLIAKGKSMVTEECALNEALSDAGFRVRETDLGEYIIQEAQETPSHIVGPALHKTEAEIRELFLQQHDLGDRDLADATAMVHEAREVLREEFLSADVGIVGSNALIADTGYSMLVTNEGNGDLCANLPPVLIICTTVDRVLPRGSDAMAMLRLLVRSTTGQAMSCYTSFYSGPRRPGDSDGPLETHIVLLDNQRSDILASDYREMLQCMRCGACLNHCPIYMSAGGHAYGWVYPGPMGSVLTPLLTSLADSEQLPNACTACGRCEEVCPAAIPLPDLLRDLRAELYEDKITARRWRLGLHLHAWLVQRPRLYYACTAAATRVMYWLARGKGQLHKMPLAEGWLTARDLPTPGPETFQQEYRQGKRA